MLSLAEKLQLAERAARTSGEMLLAHPHTPARQKAENDFVTEMDINPNVRRTASWVKKRASRDIAAAAGS